MAYKDFLSAFAEAQGLSGADELLAQHAQKYAFAISTRDQAVSKIAEWRSRLPDDIEGIKILQLNCHYGSIAIELAKLGASVVAVDTADARLDLARKNASGDAPVTFVKSYINVASHVNQLAEQGPFDFVISADVLERSYDTFKVLKTLTRLLAPSGLLSYRLVNPLRPRSVLADPMRKKLGTVLLPPEYIREYIGAHSPTYYRRPEYYRAMLREVGFVPVTEDVTDTSIEAISSALAVDLRRLRQALNEEIAESPSIVGMIRNLGREYLEEVRQDLSTMPAEEAHRKYIAEYWDDLWRLRA
jgi:2-polyprenyl-3-methyl-5-hydroxy-6-metoxy-1,4-benzoquinol methylase